MGGKVKTNAWIFSACLFVLWWVLGTGVTIAWFADTYSGSANQFYFGELRLDVSYKNPVTGTYLPLSGGGNIFDSQKGYEPGYIQVAYLKIENTGNVAFRYKVSVTAENARTAAGVPDAYLLSGLKFGALFAENEPELSRLTAQSVASGDVLETWSAVSRIVVGEGQTQYVALVVYMPEEVDGDDRERSPMVDLNVTVLARQVDAPLQ